MFTRRLLGSQVAADVNKDGQVTVKEFRDFTRNKHEERYGKDRLQVTGAENYQGDANSVLFLVPKDVSSGQP